eukprot:gene11515-34229_t
MDQDPIASHGQASANGAAVTMPQQGQQPVKVDQNPFADDAAFPDAATFPKPADPTPVAFPPHMPQLSNDPPAPAPHPNPPAAAMQPGSFLMPNPAAAPQSASYVPQQQFPAPASAPAPGTYIPAAQSQGPDAMQQAPHAAQMFVAPGQEANTHPATAQGSNMGPGAPHMPMQEPAPTPGAPQMPMQANQAAAPIPGVPPQIPMQDPSAPALGAGHMVGAAWALAAPAGSVYSGLPPPGQQQYVDTAGSVPPEQQQDVNTAGSIPPEQQQYVDTAAGMVPKEQWQYVDTTASVLPEQQQYENTAGSVPPEQQQQYVNTAGSVPPEQQQYVDTAAGMVPKEQWQQWQGLASASVALCGDPNAPDGAGVANGVILHRELEQFHQQQQQQGLVELPGGAGIQPPGAFGDPPPVSAFYVPPPPQWEPNDVLEKLLTDAVDNSLNKTHKTKRPSIAAMRSMGLTDADIRAAEKAEAEKIAEEERLRKEEEAIRKEADGLRQTYSGRFVREGEEEDEEEGYYASEEAGEQFSGVAGELVEE